MLKKQYLVLFLGAVIIRFKSRKRHHGRMNLRDMQSGRWEQSRKVSRHCWWISRAPVRSCFPAEWLRCFISCVSWWRCRTSGGVAMPARKQRCIGDTKVWTISRICWRNRWDCKCGRTSGETGSLVEAILSVELLQGSAAVSTRLNFAQRTMCLACSRPNCFNSNS